METTLHRQLKQLYAEVPEACEVQLDGFRIDAVAGGELIEIQHGSLGAIRRKIAALLERGHVVRIVKPLAFRKLLVTYPARGKEPLRQRYSPRRGTPFDVFLDLVHFTTVFPHPGLTIEIVMTEQEEHRRQKKPRRFRGKNYRSIDLHLREIGERFMLKTADDLWRLINPGVLPDVFTSRDLAAAIEQPCWLAQKMTYCLRKAGTVTVAGKKRNAWLYQREEPAVVEPPSKSKRERKKRAA